MWSKHYGILIITARDGTWGLNQFLYHSIIHYAGNILSSTKYGKFFFSKIDHEKVVVCLVIHLAPRIHVSNCKRNISLALRIRPQLMVLIVDVQVDVAGFHVPSALLHLCAFVSYIGLHSVPTKLKIAYNITLLCNHASTVVVIRSCSTPTPILIILHWHSSGMVKATAS